MCENSIIILQNVVIFSGILTGNMKSLLRRVVLFTLKRLAKKKLKKFKGKVIGVTGSVGKTSTKDAIYTVLNSQFSVKRSLKSMNSEFGLLLTILDIESGYSSALKWTWLLLKAFYHSLFADHAEILLLELGVDKPKDMNFLLSVVRPDIAVMTNIAPVHLEEGQFKNLEEIFEEKRKLVDKMKEGGTAILNIDNPFIEKLAKEKGKKGTVTYGKNENADYHASKIEQSVEGLRFLITHKADRYEASAAVLGEYQISVMMPAIICANLLEMEMGAALGALTKYTLPPGRMNIVDGKNETTIIDSTYNSSPDALKEALKILKSIGEGHRKVAVLGNMNELGEESERLHRVVGESIPKYADILLTVGPDAKLFAEEAIKNGMEEKNVKICTSAQAAAEYYEEIMKKGDVVLAKGSQNKVRLERFVKAIMDRPEEAKALLVRQEKEWDLKL